jgi:class 3 adenylate cyclase
MDVRAGVHTGEVETINGKVGGVAVNIGARVAAVAEPSEILVSSTVKDLTAGSGLIFEDAGEHERPRRRIQFAGRFTRYSLMESRGWR